MCLFVYSCVNMCASMLMCLCVLYVVYSVMLYVVLVCLFVSVCVVV